MASETQIGGQLSFGDFTLHPADARLLGPAGPVKLGRKAMEVLLALIERRGRLVSKEALLASAWQGTFVSEASLTTAIRELRRALGDEPRNPRYIESVYGRGYRFVAELSAADTEKAIAAPFAAAGETAPSRGRAGARAWRKASLATAVLIAPLAVTSSASTAGAELGRLQGDRQADSSISAPCHRDAALRHTAGAQNHRYSGTGNHCRGNERSRHASRHTPAHVHSRPSE